MTRIVKIRHRKTPGRIRKTEVYNGHTYIINHNLMIYEFLMDHYFDGISGRTFERSIVMDSVELDTFIDELVKLRFVRKRRKVKVRMEVLIHGKMVEIYNKKKGWYMPLRWHDGMYNPVAGLRDYLIIKKDYNKVHDKMFGKFYLWNEGEITGVTL